MYDWQQEALCSLSSSLRYADLSNTTLCIDTTGNKTGVKCLDKETTFSTHLADYESTWQVRRQLILGTEKK